MERVFDPSPTPVNLSLFLSSLLTNTNALLIFSSVSEQGLKYVFETIIAG